MSAVRTALSARRRPEAGYTLLEIILVVGVLAVVMIPLLAWTVMAFQRSSDDTVTSATRGLTQVSRFLDADVAVARSVAVPVSGTRPGNPCPIVSSADPGEVVNTGTVKTWLTTLDTSGKSVVYLTDRLTSPGKPDVIRLFRLTCSNGVSAPAELLVSGLVEVPAPSGPGTVEAAVSCTARPGLVETCGIPTVKLQAASGADVTVRSVRRLGAPRDANFQPVADIRCVPDCIGTRDAANSFTVTLDGNFSTSPGGTPTPAWSFDDPSVPQQNGLRTDPITFTCTRLLQGGAPNPRWNAGIQGCTFKATLTITDPAGRQSSRDQQIVVLNAVPVVSVAPAGVDTFRADPVCFDASATRDADDPTGAGLTYSWQFDDPAPGAVNTASGSGVPVADCAAAIAAATQGVVSHTYSQTTGSTPRQARLTVSDADGSTQTVTIPVSVGNKPPVAVISSTTNQIDGLPSGAITWDGTQSFDPDGNATNTGPAPIVRYEWALTNAQGQIYKNFTASGATVTLADPGITDIGVYTITLTVYDLSDPTVFTQTTRIISINNRPRAVISQVTPTGGIITPENGQPSITLNGGPAGTDPGSFDPDPNSSITNYTWEFWTSSTTTRPTQACSGTVAPPCIINGGTSPTITFGPAQANVIPPGSYRVKLVVKDDNNAANNCATGSPYNSTCIDNPSTTTQRWWTDVKINRVPQATVNLPQRCSNSVTIPFTAPCVGAGTIVIDQTGSPNRAVFRRDWTQFAAVGPSGSGSPTDPDGSVSTVQWTFTKAGSPVNALTEPAAGSSSLNVASPVVRFLEPDKDYQVDATVRITDNNGGFFTNTYRFWVRNKVPTAGITVFNFQTQQTVGNAFLNNWATTNPAGPATGPCSTASPQPALNLESGPACFQFDAGAATDQDGFRQAQLWRVWRVPASGPRVQLAEFGDQNTNGTTCQINTAFAGRPVLPAANCFVFSYSFTEYGTYAVVLQAYDNDGGFSTQQEVLVKVNRPPLVDGIFACPVPASGTPNCTVSTPVQNVDGTQGRFAFNPVNPRPASTDSGGAVQNYRWEWDDGTSTTLSNTNPFTKSYDSTNPGVSTGLNGQWRVRLTVIDASSGTASVTQLVRFNRRPVAGVSSAGSVGVVSGLPTFRLNNCTPAPSNPDQGVCTLPAVDGSAPTFSNDPDAQPAPGITEWRWYTPNYSSANPDTGILTFLNSAQARSTTSGVFPSSLGNFQIGFTDALGPQIFLAVKDADNAWSTNSAGFRVTANRAPRRLQVDSPTAVSGNAPVQRNVPTTFQISTQDDLWSFAGPTTFTLGFRDGSGNPVTFLDANGVARTSVTGTAPLVNGAVSGATGSVFSPTVTLTQNATGLQAVLTATDSEGLSVSQTNTVRYDVVDASPVAVITPASPATAAPNPPNADRTYVFTSSAATPPAFAFQLNGATSFDPDGGPGGTSGPVSSYSWTVTNTSAGSPTSCSTGEFPNTGSNGTFACTLPQSYGTYRVTLDVWDAPAGTPGRRTGSTTWTVKVNRAPTTPTLTTNTPSVTGLSTPVTFTASASDPNPDGGIYSYTFDFGNGVTQTFLSGATTFSTSYTYPAFGQFAANVTVTDIAGATATSLPRTVTVNQSPTARLAITRVNDPAGSCGTADPCVVNQPPPGRPAPTVNLDASGSTDPDGSVSSYQWTITRVSSPSVPPPAPPTLGGVASGNVTFNGPGLYNVTVQVGDNNTPTAGTATISRQVRVNAAPSATLPASFSCQRLVACAFTATASDPENDAITNWSWQLLDANKNPLGAAVSTAAGSLSQVVNLPAPGTGNGFVRVTVTDANNGVSDTAEAPLTVTNQLPTARVTTNPTPPRITPSAPGSPQVVSLDGSTSSDPDGGTLTYQWTVKDAGPGGATRFTASGPSVTVGPGNTTNPLGRGVYVVTLVVNDGQGGQSPGVDTTVTINGAPTASAVVTPAVVNPSVPQQITLDGSGSGDPDGDTIASYSWTITGPGGFSTTTSGATPPAITLGGFGAYTVTLTVDDGKGGTGTATTTVRRNQAPTAAGTVAPEPQPTPPVAACTLAPATTCVVNPGQDLRLSGAGTTDPDGDAISTYAWRLLDPANANAVVATASGVSTTITRPANGAYKLELTVTDAGGAQAQVTGDVLVNQAPTAAIDGILPTIVVGRSGTAPEDVVEFLFSATAADPEGRGIQRYDWRFLSGSTVLATASSVAPSLDNTTLQSFAVLVPSGTVELTVTDVDGAVTTVTKPFQVVNRAPLAQLEQNPTDDVGVPGYAVQYTIRALRDPDGSLTASSFQVCPPDPTTGQPVTGAGCTSVAPDLTNGHAVTFPNFGTYRVTLSATDNDGATTTDVRTIKINRPPVARIRDAGTPTAPIELTSPAGVAYKLDGTAPTYSNDPDGTVVGYSWTITNGATLVDTGSNPTLTRSYTPGTYTVTLQVFDDNGGDDTFIATLRVT